MSTDTQKDREAARISLGREASNSAFNLKQIDWSRLSEREQGIIIDILERCAAELFVRTPVPVEAPVAAVRKPIAMFSDGDDVFACCDDGTTWTRNRHKNWTPASTDGVRTQGHAHGFAWRSRL